MALIAEWQPVALSPFSRIRTIASFSSQSFGDSVRSHLKLWFVPLDCCWRDVLQALRAESNRLQLRK